MNTNRLILKGKSRGDYEGNENMINFIEKMRESMKMNEEDINDQNERVVINQQSVGNVDCIDNQNNEGNNSK